ncbi:hypothetical protein WM23_07675 [Burkholderia ubonensis]|nr:hypothetical protein WM23_07675 [Burkholderia ubonensis]
MAIHSWLDFTAAFEATTKVRVELNNKLLTEFAKNKKFDTGDYASLVKELTANYSALALQHYFHNGGGACYLLPLADDVDAKGVAQLSAEIEKYPDITLLVCAQPDASMPPNGKKPAIYAALGPLLAKDKNKGYFLIADSDDGKTVPDTEAEQTAVYYPAIETTLRHLRPADAEIAITFAGGDGKVEEGTFEKFPPKDEGEAKLEEVETLAGLQQHWPELYRSISEAIDARIAALEPVVLPPSAAVAGAYASTDRARGVWKAPANVPLKGVNTLTTLVSDDEQGEKNLKGINVIRHFTDRGPLIWGTRTLAVASDEWRYVPVRRLFNAVQRDVKAAMRAVVFEPNSQATWAKAKGAIESYLTKLWRNGALAGNKESEAFFVQVGEGVTMSSDDIKQGHMIIKIGLAAVRPAEFIILQFTQEVGASA